MHKISSWLIVNRPDWEQPTTTFFWQNNVNKFNNTIENCAALNVSSTDVIHNWYIENCTFTNAFMCQKPAGVCSNGFEQYEEKCFLFKENVKQSWNQAKLYCETFESNLLEIESDAEQNFVTKKLQQRRIIPRLWIGLKGKQVTNGSLSLDKYNYYWVMSKGSRVPTYLNIRPSGGRNTCGYIDPGRSGGWYFDLPCNTPLPFICYHDVKNGNVQPRQFTTLTTPKTTTPQKTTRTSVPAVTLSKKTTSVVQTSTTKTTPTTTTPVVFDPVCGYNWELEQRSQICYMFNLKPSTWSSARSACQSVGGELISINNLKEHYYISGRLREKILSTAGMFWTGGHDESDEGGWIWSDGSPFSFFNFKRGEPNGKSGQENCISISGQRAVWFDNFCSNKYASICKKRVTNDTGNLPATSPPFPSGDSVYGCPGEEWSGYRLSCYFVARNKTSWTEAQSYCKSAGGNLVSILDEGEQAFVYSLLPASHCYNIHGSDSSCDKWAKEGECDKNPLWMANNCQLSCQRCFSVCRDEFGSTECQHWAKSGECYKNHKWMLQNCALSCGICDSAIYGGFWTGLHDRKDEMAFEWSDGMKVSYTTWADREPNNMGRSGQDCVMMKLLDGRWVDFNCNEKMPGFVCKTSKRIVPKATVSPLSVGCSNGSVGYNAFCYGYYDTPMSWSEAEIFCGNMSGHLATVNDRYVQAFVASQIVGRQGDFWIGLTQSYDTGITESWTSGQDVKFTYWSNQHTGALEEDGFCVSMSANHPVGLWSTFNCSVQKTFICEFPREGFTTPTTTSPTTTVPKACETGWHEYEGNCYMKFSKENWLNSRDMCKRMGAELTSVHSYEENQFLFYAFVEYMDPCWIGLSDRDLEAGFSWEDGSAVDFTSWGDNEPNDYYNNEDCVGFYNSWSSEWNDWNCYDLRSYICRIPKGMPVLSVVNYTLPEPQPCADSRFIYINGLCYYFEPGNVKRTWYESQDSCNNLTASLVTITSQYQHDVLYYHLQKKSEDQSFWIGLNDIDHQGWKWADGTKVISYIGWAANEPNDIPTKRCVYEWPDSNRWYTSNCNLKLSGLVCMKRNGSDVIRTTPTTVMQPWGCPSGFIESKISNKCYKVVQGSALSFNEAKQECSKLGKEYFLASIHSDMENAFIALQLDTTKSYNVWIGLSDESFESQFIWLDNSPVDFTNWNNGEPNSYSENCAEMIVSGERIGKWNDAPCSSKRGYICQTNKAFRYPTQPTPVSGCPSGYTSSAGTCYRVISAAMDFDGAQATCQVDGGNLASINSAFEQLSIEVATKNIVGAIWIGLKRKDDVHSWLDGWPYSYTKWAVSEPSLNPGENCTVLLNREWKDTVCDLTYAAICEYNTEKPPTTPPPGTCPSDSSRFQRNCYFADPDGRKTWTEAQKACVARGMNLVTFRNIQEVEHVRQLVSKKGGRSTARQWIGLSKEGSSRKKRGFYDDYEYEDNLEFTWIDGIPNSFENWNDGEPSGSWGHESENCVEMLSSGKFNDVNCDNYYKGYVCYGPEKYDAVTSTSALESPASSTSDLVYNPINRSTLSSENLTDINTDTPLFPGSLPSIKTKLDRSESAVLTAGQIIGILIGAGTLLMIGIVIIFVSRHYFRTGSYSANNEHGFTNAMYLKNADSVSMSGEGTVKNNT
ncbi:macrophage mannose receptor 1-like isoform X2 [Ostrea edulis]|nr:macrophage mannose receptor 1-like isoform X2 [Ostrea edulis]